MIRKNFMELSTDEQSLLIAGFNYAFKEKVIAEHADAHARFFSFGIHWRPQFLPWHRYFLRKLELKMQEHDSSIMLPYWDWTNKNSRDLDKHPKAEESPWYDNFGSWDLPYGKLDTAWTFNRSRSNGAGLPSMYHTCRELTADSYKDFRRIEGTNRDDCGHFQTGSHVHAHQWVGGEMGKGRSPIDPLFYLHHCNLDRLWSIWQLNNNGAEQYDAAGQIPSDEVAVKCENGQLNCAPYLGVNDNMPAVGDTPGDTAGFTGATPQQMLDHTKLGFFPDQIGYTYSRDSRLEAWYKGIYGSDLTTTHSSLPMV